MQHIAHHVHYVALYVAYYATHYVALYVAHYVALYVIYYVARVSIKSFAISKEHFIWLVLNEREKLNYC
jgi:hypothetical protein